MITEDKIKAVDKRDPIFFEFVQNHMDDYRTLEEAEKAFKDKRRKQK